MKREKKQPLTKLAKAAKTGPPALVSSTNDGLFTDLLLLVEAENNAVINAVDDNVSTTSTEVNVDDSKRASYTLGGRQDRVLVATSDAVTITSTSEPLRTITFNTNRWAHFVAVMANVDEEAKELGKDSPGCLS